MISNDIVIVESVNGWFVIGRNSMGPFTSRDVAAQLGERLLVIQRISTASSQLYSFERETQNGTPVEPATAALPVTQRLANLDSDIRPLDGARLFRQASRPHGASATAGPTL